MNDVSLGRTSSMFFSSKKCPLEYITFPLLGSLFPSNWAKQHHPIVLLSAWNKFSILEFFSTVPSI